jgi:hypothetical protein
MLLCNDGVKAGHDNWQGKWGSPYGSLPYPTCELNLSW